MRQAWHILLGTVISLGVMYGVYWVFKTISYALFYEGMVKATIHEMVKQVALR
jgi:hypothetical protein